MRSPSYFEALTRRVKKSLSVRASSWFRARPRIRDDILPECKRHPYQGGESFPKFRVSRARALKFNSRHPRCASFRCGAVSRLSRAVIVISSIKFLSILPASGLSPCSSNLTEANNAVKGLTIFCRVKALPLSRPPPNDLRDHDDAPREHSDYPPASLLFSETPRRVIIKKPERERNNGSALLYFNTRRYEIQ